MTKAEREAIHVLWDELSEFPVAQTDAALVHLMEGICKFVNAGNAFWIGVMRLDAIALHDPLRGWRPRANRYLYPSSVHDEAYRAQVAKMHRCEANEAHHVAVRNAGKFRSYRIRQELPASWFRGEYYKAFHGSRGFYDECYVTFPLHEDYESYFAFHRTASTRNFTAKEEELASYTLRGIRWFHRQLALSHGLLLAEEPLSPTQRQIVHLLLTERSEKQIAQELNQSPHTTHAHIVEIFRKFGVQSRAALMALWLGQKRQT